MLEFLQFASIVSQLTESQGEQYQGNTQKRVCIQIFIPSVPKILFGKLSMLFFGGGWSKHFSRKVFWQLSATETVQTGSRQMIVMSPCWLCCHGTSGIGYVKWADELP